MKILYILVILIEKNLLILPSEIVPNNIYIVNFMKRVVTDRTGKKRVRFMVYACNEDILILTKETCILCIDDYFTASEYSEDELNFEYVLRSFVGVLRKLYKNVQCNKEVTFVDYSFD